MEMSITGDLKLTSAATVSVHSQGEARPCTQVAHLTPPPHLHGTIDHPIAAALHLSLPVRPLRQYPAVS